MLFDSRARDEPSHLSRIIFPKALALPLQTLFRLLKFAGRASPRSINIIMTHPDQDQIRKSLAREQLTDLSGKITRAEDLSKKIWPVPFVINQSAAHRIQWPRVV
jgi:hypothetical protein